MDKNKRIAIIGAGAAGLTAAHYLREKGYQRITLFEKNDHVGGQGRTIEVGDRNYELGTLVVGIPYDNIRSLAEENRMPMAPLDTIRLLDLNKAKDPWVPRMRMYLYRSIPMTRCAFRCLTKYRHIGRPGYKGLDRNDLGQTFVQWAEQKGMASVIPVVASLHVGWGYGYLEHVAAAYVFKLTDLYLRSIIMRILHPRREIRMRFLIDGYQRLWEKIGAKFDLRLGVDIQAIRRGETVEIQTGQQSETFDQLILACPLDDSLRFLDASPQEKSLFTRIRTLDFHAISCRVKNAPPYNLVFVNNHLYPARPGRSLSWYKRWPDDDMCVFYAIGDHRISTDEMQTALARDLQRLGARLADIRQWVRWKYFPHVTADDFRKGFYETLEGIQGRQHTYYAGELLSFSTVEHVAGYSRSLVAAHF